MPAAEIISLDVDEEDKAESSHTSSQKREVDLNIIKRVFSKASIILRNHRLRCGDKFCESQLFGNMNKRAFNVAAEKKRVFTVPQNQKINLN